MFQHDTAPIAAIATAPGRGGIGVIRISGQDLSSFALELLKIEPKPRQAHYLSFTDQDGELIDNGIAIFLVRLTHTLVKTCWSFRVTVVLLSCRPF